MRLWYTGCDEILDTSEQSREVTVIHVGDLVDYENNGRTYTVDSVSESTAHGVYVNDYARGISMPLSATGDLIGDQFRLSFCAHKDTPTFPKRPASVIERGENQAYNLGVLDGTLREVSWLLRDLQINCGAMSESVVYTTATNGLTAIHRAYSILKPTMRSDAPGAMLSQKELPPVN